MYDFAVIGAGYGGLSAAALLSKKGYKIIAERKLYIPVINADILIPAQSSPFRPDIICGEIKHLYFSGDTTHGDGCSGDIAFSSALKLDDLII